MRSFRTGSLNTSHQGWSAKRGRLGLGLVAELRDDLHLRTLVGGAHLAADEDEQEGWDQALHIFLREKYLISMS